MVLPDITGTHQGRICYVRIDYQWSSIVRRVVVGSRHELSIPATHEFPHLLVSAGLPLKIWLSSFTRKTGCSSAIQCPEFGTIIL
jgi:hypothetical protein